MKKLTIFALIAALLAASLVGCASSGQPISGSNSSIDPTAIVESDSGIYVGTRFEKAPEIPALRSAEEIASTSLTAQDVLNAYDQLATDIAKGYYATSPMGDLPKDVIDATVAQFDCITPSSWVSYDENDNVVTWTAPFYVFNPNHAAYAYWHGEMKPTIPAYTVTMYLTSYTDGIRLTTELPGAGVEQSAFERMLDAYGQKQYQLDYDTLFEQTDGYHGYFEAYYCFLDAEAYEGMTITRETIENATPEQLEAIYSMLDSLRTITIHQELPG